jgi:hypothetical protein
MCPGLGGAPRSKSFAQVPRSCILGRWTSALRSSRKFLGASWTVRRSGALIVGLGRTGVPHVPVEESTERGPGQWTAPIHPLTSPCAAEECGPEGTRRVHRGSGDGSREGSGKGHLAAYGNGRLLLHGPNIGGNRGDNEHQEEGEQYLQEGRLQGGAGREGGAQVGDTSPNRAR